MDRRIRRTAALLIAAFSLVCMPLEALAATKPINSVSIRVSSKVKAGYKLPETIQVGSGSVEEGGVSVSGSNARYKVTAAEWLDKTQEKIEAAAEPRMKVTIEPEDVSEYYFLASYKASNIKISGGSYVSAKRDGDALVVTLRINPVKGDYDSPKDAYWNEKKLGEARWEKSENDSGYYEVQLFRDDKSVLKIEKTSGKNYNFYPYMTKAGEYTFKVRTIPGTDTQNKYGKKSEWVESSSLDIRDRDVSDGKGQTSGSSSVIKGTTDTVGWVKVGDVWNYRYPDGNISRNGWSEINGLWYYFNGDGTMVTGWQEIDGAVYYLQPDGQMSVGWSRIEDKWYYFRVETEGHAPKGSMVSPGWRVIGTDYFYFNSDGSMYTGWLNLDGKIYYLNTLDNSLQGALFTGWIHRDEKSYFADANGEILQGWNQIDGSWYYFYPGSGEMAHDTQIDGFPIGSDGIWR